MAGMRPPPGSGGKQSGGGFWDFVNRALDSVSVEVRIGPTAPPPRSPPGNPVDPAARMESIRQDRREIVDELIYRATNGANGQAPMVRIERERQQMARSLQRRASSSNKPAIPRGGGEPLSKEVRATMEPRLGADLSGVRVHRSADAAESAEALDAKAFTVGQDVHFASGNFQPGTKEGDRLLAHELTHVVQAQRSGVQRKAEDTGGDYEGGGQHGAEHHRVSEPSDPAEKEADAKGDEIAENLHGTHRAESRGPAGRVDGRPAHQVNSNAEAQVSAVAGADGAGTGNVGTTEGKPASDSAKDVGIGSKVYRKPIVGADGTTPLGQEQRRASGARAPEGPNMQPIIGKLSQAITMFTAWAQRPADPANTIAQQILRELEGCREEAHALAEAQAARMPESHVAPRRQALATRLQTIRTLDPQYALISISEMSVTVTNARRQMPPVSLPPWTTLQPALRPEYERQLREQHW